MSEATGNSVDFATEHAIIASLHSASQAAVNTGMKGETDPDSCAQARVKDLSFPTSRMLGKPSLEGEGAACRQNSRAPKARAGVSKGLRSERSSTELSERSALEMLAAIQEAILIGLPLNVFLTINLEQGSVPDCVAAIGKFLTYHRQWVRSRGYDTAHVWTQERGPATGQHVHILLHVPHALAGELGKRQRGWLKRCGAVSGRGLINSRPVGKSHSVAFGDRASQRDYLRNLRVVTSYVLKQVPDQARSNMNIDRIVACSLVIGKRSATSQNIGRKARRARGRIKGPSTPWSLMLPRAEVTSDGEVS